jgi:hypothetical protein
MRDRLSLEFGTGLVRHKEMDIEHHWWLCTHGRCLPLSSASLPRHADRREEMRTPWLERGSVTHYTAPDRASRSGAVEVDARVAISKARNDPWRAAGWLQ